jgi:uncharacterized radical SAM superfamily Fe-S cluster-containing enzyme
VHSVYQCNINVRFVFFYTGSQKFIIEPKKLFRFNGEAKFR